MAIDFRLSDFLRPVDLLRFRHHLERAQWWPEDSLQHHQSRHLRAVVAHAVANVPYYRAAFAHAGLSPDDVRTSADLRRLPTLTKHGVLQAGEALWSRQAARFDPRPVSSTGTTGPPLSVHVDGRTNALEFAFYWRHWGWFGYRLGHRFAQLAWSPFTGARRDVVSMAEPLTGRLLLNARALSADRASQWAVAMTTHRARFLKGHPSALLHFALFVRDRRLDLPRLEAVFTTGEVLEPSARQVIQDVLGARVADAYGSMERVVAACECPSGRMHVNADYGLWQEEPADADPLSGTPRARVVGTGLYTYGMPLIRFELGDLVEPGPPGPCACGRTLPTVGRIHGRSVDAVTTPDGRLITAAAIVFNGVPGVLRGQLVQEDLTHLRLRILADATFGDVETGQLVDRVATMMGRGLTATVERVSTPDEFGAPGEKHRAVLSAVTRQAVAAGRPLP